MTLIKRADGRVEEFDSMRVLSLCKRLGVPGKFAHEVIAKVKNQLKYGDTTQRIAQLVKAELPFRFSLLYGLREAVAALEPAKFEVYVSRVLIANGYACTTNVIIPGEAIEHEVDIIAAKKDNLFLVECKHHINPHRDCGLDNVLQLQATLEDIEDGYKKKQNPYHFTQGWLITNTRFSAHASHYAAAKNIMLSGWRYKSTFSLTHMIEHKHAFPTTILQLPRHVISFFMRNNILTIQDILLNKHLLSITFGRKIVKEALTQILTL